MSDKLNLPIPMQVHGGQKKGKLREYVEALLTAFLVAFFIRSFVIEAFKIPSASMVPTLMIGDHLFVNKFVYGLRIPFTKKKIVHFRDPERGEPIVFMYPMDESKDFIKRVVGLPGDRIKIKGDDIWVNEQPVTRMALQIATPPNGEETHKLSVVSDAAAAQAGGLNNIPYFKGWENYQFYLENMGTARHLMQLDIQASLEEQEIIVPEGHLFVMGDNRDNSSDSRDWGFVPLENVKGRAMFIWLSIDYEGKTLRWNRFGKGIY